jgi:hypothetical protein
MWNIILLIAFVLLLWYCSIKAYFSNRKDRMEGNNDELGIGPAEIIDIDSDEPDWDIGETRVKVIHSKK